MKKQVCVSLALVLLALLIPTQFCTAGTFGVIIGDEFTYDCVASERSVVWGTNSSSSEGYALEGHNFAVGTSVSVEVVNLISDSVAYTVSKDGYMEGYLSELIYFTSALMFTYHNWFHMYKNEIAINGWNQLLWDQAPLLHLDDAFIEIDSTTWTSIIDVLEYIVESYATVITSGLTLDAPYSNGDSIFAFELHLYGILNSTYTPTSPATPWSDYSDDFDYRCKIAYDKSTGALLGIRMYGSTTGIHNVTNYEFSLDSHFEQEGYDLPATIDTNTNGFSGFNITIALGSITTLVLIAVFTRRKKASI
ncbi:MAG: choice-of-anchor S family protein [Candidatus Heimdallarchaeota archaeon]